MHHDADPGDGRAQRLRSGQIARHEYQPALGRGLGLVRRADQGTHLKAARPQPVRHHPGGMPADTCHQRHPDPAHHLPAFLPCALSWTLGAARR